MGSTYGDGIAAGINSGIGNLMQGINIGTKAYLGGRQQKTDEDHVELEKRKQRMAVGQMQSNLAGQPNVGASALARPKASGSYVPASAESYATPTLMGEVGPQPKPEQTWNPMGEVGADALVAPQAPGAMKDPDELSLDELQELSYNYHQQSKQNALSNENDIDSLQAAYHYQSNLTMGKPYLDQWATALNEVRANPQNPDKWRKVMVLTGEDDPARALSLATGEYSKLRSQYDTISSKLGPLQEYLTSRGITPEMYGDEAKFLQFRNQMKFKPHTPQRGKVPGASVLGRKPQMRSR